MTDICERLVRFKDKVCVSSDLEIEAADTIEALRAENARLTAENEELAAIVGKFIDKGGLDQVRALVRAAIGESDAS